MKANAEKLKEPVRTAKNRGGDGSEKRVNKVREHVGNEAKMQWKGGRQPN